MWITFGSFPKHVVNALYPKLACGFGRVMEVATLKTALHWLVLATYIMHQFSLFGPKGQRQGQGEGEG